MNAGDGGPEFDYHQTNPTPSAIRASSTRGLSRLGTYRYQSPEGCAETLATRRRSARRAERRAAPSGATLARGRGNRSTTSSPIGTTSRRAGSSRPRSSRSHTTTLSRGGTTQTRQARAIDYATGRRNPVDDVDTNGARPDRRREEAEVRRERRRVPRVAPHARRPRPHRPRRDRRLHGAPGTCGRCRPDGAATTPPDAIDQGEPPPDPAG